MGYCKLDLSSAPYRVLEKFDFKVVVPETFALKIKKKDWWDPLLLQVIPREEENVKNKKGFSKDPVGDKKAIILEGLLQKYGGRALLLTSNKCFIHCRYCFRRYQPTPSLPLDGSSDEKVIKYLRQRDDIRELILSGGDPFTLSNNRLKKILLLISNIPHIKTLRIHTRAPVVFPSRINSGLLKILSTVKKKQQLIIVLHINHPAEIDKNVKQTIKKLRNTGAILLNQAVLLKDINDSVDIQQNLSESLLSIGVLPYYLHQLDKAEGTAHFEVTENMGKKIIEELKKTIAGYAVPRYVKEVIGRKSKELIV
ncbi:MAG: KamA family radical SAM protein [Chitinispirillaceae bacterium]|nr:KamA family radical SAM protein [Chitinispirillaceae bacterium]